LWINNSGGAENEVSKNTFIELAVGQMFRGVNAAASDTIKRKGLQTLCNHFQKSKDFDILAGDYQNIQLPYFNHSIRDYQGNLNCPAGNLFYNNPTVNIEIRNPLNAITYYYGNQPPENPLITTNVTKSNTDSVNGCPSKIEIMDIIAEEELNMFLSQYDEWNDEYEYWLAKLNEFEDDRGDNSEEYDFIFNMVSYYSALKDNHFNWIIVSAMNIWGEEGDEGESRKQKAESRKQ